MFEKLKKVLEVEKKIYFVLVNCKNEAKLTEIDKKLNSVDTSKIFIVTNDSIEFKRVD